MEGIHVGFGRRICTDASSKPLPITTVLSAVFSSPWHKSDGQNCVAPAMERFSSEFWCGGRRNTRVFQGRQAGNHRKSPMSGGTDPFHVCPCFLLALLFRKRRGTTFSLCRTFTRRRRISLFFGQSPKNFRTFSLFIITYNFSSLVFTVKNCTALLCGAGYVLRKRITCAKR